MSLGQHPAVLLDTCAIIYFASGTLSEDAERVLVAASRGGGVYVSVISAWEIGLLGRGKLSFLPDPKTWFARILAAPGIRLSPFTTDIALDSSQLPGSLHGDPADRLLITTARHMGIALMTRDRKIMAYRALGHVQVVPC